MKHAFDRAATAMASHLTSWLEQHVDVVKREWVDAMAAELDDMDTGWQRLTWALSGLPLVWSFRPARAIEPHLVLSGSLLMNESSFSAASRSSSRDYFAVLTALLLSMIVVGYIVFLLPVFQSIAASFDSTLDVAGVDFAHLGTRVAQVALLVFLIAGLYVARRPRVEHAGRAQTLLGGVNMLLGTSAVMLGVTLVQFVIVFIPQAGQQRAMRFGEQAALYRLAAVGDPSEAERVVNSGGAAAARFSALTRFSHEALRARDTGPMAAYEAEQLLAMLPKFEKHSAYADAVLYANLLAGHVAFERGRMHDARRYLLAAGSRPDAPPMTAAPNMRLAKDLLDNGDQRTVVAFLAQCRRFWPGGAERLETWTREINAGGKPDFGRNLNN